MTTPKVRAFWKSAKGYSVPNEIVTLTGREQAGKIEIISRGDPGTESGAEFGYWVFPSELSIIPEGFESEALAHRATRGELTC